MLQGRIFLKVEYPLGVESSKLCCMFKVHEVAKPSPLGCLPLWASSSLGSSGLELSKLESEGSS